MRKETTFLIALLLLANATPVAWSQEDSSTEDLETLLDSAEAGSGGEVSDSAAAETEAAVVTPPPSDTPASEPVSSETVDINTESTTPVETTETADTTEPSPVSELGDSADGVEESASDMALAPLDEKDFANDDLEELKKDIGSEDKELTAGKEEIKKQDTAKTPDSPDKTPTLVEKKPEEPAVFDVGREERELLTIAQNIQGQISDSEWNEVATAAKASSYTVVNNDWLFKISKRFFGSGFYYPKIWSLNSYITNPHFIEPGMILSFTTGSGSNAPEVKLGTFTDDEINSTPGSTGNSNASDLANFGDDVKPKWLEEKAELENQGIYFQYASEETMEDLTKVGAQALNREYENYDPPRSEFDVIIPKNYDKNGFDKFSRIYYTFKEGFYLNTFISTNIVQDFGAITNGPDENIFFIQRDRAYVKFDESINALAGDKFSIYTSGGKVKHANSDRQGYKYTIVGQVKLIRKIKDKWEVEFVEVSGTPQRGDRVTAYTPKIDRITKTYNSKMIEAAILASYEPIQTLLGGGSVMYLDRGRADGVELGNVLEVFGFKDRATGRNITDQPTYKLGEVTVISLTDNFATALATSSVRDYYVGDIAITKTKDSFLREQKAKTARSKSEKELLGGRALEELDVELNLENLNDDLLKQADKIQLTEDELAELERQEREKSVIKDSERDLKSLERLENEIEQAEGILNDAKLDEDKLLEEENLNDIEKKKGNVDQDSLDEIEENLGKRYVDEDLNSKDNPYGLTEFDVEEVDELLNTEKTEEKK